MTPAEWLTCQDPQRMLEWVRRGNAAADDDYPPNYPHCPVRISDRKLRSWVEACRLRWPCLAGSSDLSDPYDLSQAAEVWAITNHRSVPVGEIAVLLRDIVGDPSRRYAWSAIHDASPSGHELQFLDERWRTPTVRSLAQAAYDERSGGKCERCEGRGWSHSGRDADDDEYACATCGKPAGVYGHPWKDGVRMCPKEDCSHCYGTGRIDDGCLDPVRLAILADAIEEAGCPAELYETRKILTTGKCPRCGDQGFWRQGIHFDHMKKCRVQECGGTWVPGEEYVVRVATPHPLLAHLRSPGPHYRGMWSLDILLGKE